VKTKMALTPVKRIRHLIRVNWKKTIFFLRKKKFNRVSKSGKTHGTVADESPCMYVGTGLMRAETFYLTDFSKFKYRYQKKRNG
jgi:hypothetical protein